MACLIKEDATSGRSSTTDVQQKQLLVIQPLVLLLQFVTKSEYIIKNDINGNVLIRNVTVPGLKGKASHVFNQNDVEGDVRIEDVTVSKDLKVIGNTINGGSLNINTITAESGDVDVKKNTVTTITSASAPAPIPPNRMRRNLRTSTTSTRFATLRDPVSSNSTMSPS